jgi:hypothetical protein
VQKRTWIGDQHLRGIENCALLERFDRDAALALIALDDQTVAPIGIMRPQAQHLGHA